jgi:hypothetical protein
MASSFFVSKILINQDLPNDAAISLGKEIIWKKGAFVGLETSCR